VPPLHALIQAFCPSLCLLPLACRRNLLAVLVIICVQQDLSLRTQILNPLLVILVVLASTAALVRSRAWGTDRQADRRSLTGKRTTNRQTNRQTDLDRLRQAYIWMGGGWEKQQLQRLWQCLQLHAAAAAPFKAAVAAGKSYGRRSNSCGCKRQASTKHDGCAADCRRCS
jgi:hypothetical protein